MKYILALILALFASSAFAQSGGNYVPPAAIFSSASVGSGTSAIAPPTNGMYVIGNVGIGTSTPTHSLTIAASGSPNLGFYSLGINKIWNIGASSTSLFFNEQGVSTRLALLAGGNVGIGTVSPISILSINGVVTYYGTAPTCGTGCASITSGSTNTRGSMVSSSSVSSVTLTFASTGSGVWSTNPFCTISDNNSTAVADISAVSTSALTVSLASALSAVTIYYHCDQ